jgi:hypothetical protein
MAVIRQFQIGAQVVEEDPFIDLTANEDLGDSDSDAGGSWNTDDDPRDRYFDECRDLDGFITGAQLRIIIEIIDSHNPGWWPVCWYAYFRCITDDNNLLAGYMRGVDSIDAGEWRLDDQISLDRRKQLFNQAECFYCFYQEAKNLIHLALND